MEWSEVGGWWSVRGVMYVIRKKDNRLAFRILKERGGGKGGLMIDKVSVVYVCVGVWAVLRVVYGE